MYLFLTLLLTLRFLVSLLLTLNIFHILHDVENAKIHALDWKERKKSKQILAENRTSYSCPPHKLQIFLFNMFCKLH